MWVQGKPGSGKSVLASQIVRDVSTLDGVVVLYVFCKAGRENKNTLESLLRNLVFQLLEKSNQSSVLHKFVLNARLSEKTPYVRSTEALWDILARMLREDAIIFCILDGLDECISSVSERDAFVTRLTSTFEQNCSQAKLIAISQVELPKMADLQLRWNVVQIQSSNVQGDIEKLASTNIQGSKVLKTHPKKAELLEKVVANSEGMILWTKLMIQELEAGRWNVEQVLKKPPRSLSAMYSAIIDRIVTSNGHLERIQYALKHIITAARPLRLEELALSTAMTEGLQNHSDYDQWGEATTDGRKIVSECSPLLTIMLDGTFQVIHSSLNDYLLRSVITANPTGFFFQESESHAHMTSLLIKDVSFDRFNVE